jgi:hypothetical protein
MDIGALVNQFGLPVGLAIFFIWREWQSSKEHKADLKDIATKAVQAIDKSTDAINDSVKSITDNSTALRDNTSALNQIKGAMDRGIFNGRGNGN